MVITVQCPSCDASFPVDAAKVPLGGVHARCSRCSAVFFVDRPEMPAAAPVERAPEVSSVAAAEEAADVPNTVAPHEPASAELEASRADRTGTEPLTVEEEDAPVAVAEPDEPVEPSDPQATEQRPEAEAEPLPAFSFGRRDPHEKARRLARVLVSDMIVYNPQRHTQAVASGSLKDDFDEEIRKSWQEYRDQVGDELARTTPYFNDALNEILAQGNPLFP